MTPIEFIIKILIGIIIFFIFIFFAITVDNYLNSHIYAFGREMSLKEFLKTVKYKQFYKDKIDYLERYYYCYNNDERSKSIYFYNYNIEIRDYKKITYISFNLSNFILYELYFYLILPFKSKRVKSVK